MRALFFVAIALLSISVGSQIELWDGHRAEMREAGHSAGRFIRGLFP